MTARVLVVDDILANVRLLEAKLAAEYFEVVTAMNGADALEAVHDLKVSNGVINMSKNDHLGLDQRARVIVRIVGGKWKLD